MNTNNLFNLKGEKAIVTGGSRGLGASMAEALLEAGAKVIIIGSSNKIFETTKKFRNKNYDCHCIKANLISREENYRAFNEAMELLDNELNILCTVAGIQRRHQPEDFPIEDWDDVISINLNSVWIFNQEAGKVMLKEKQGKIINVASMLSFFGGTTVSAYAAAKGGVAQLTKALSNDWSSQGINVNAIAPGYMETEMNTALLNNEERYSQITNRIPKKRWGSPDDMKGITLFLASNASDYITGAIIPVDGGYLVK
ncbi:MAG: SDR family oxidoreductase [Pleomorphochaeta sp.]